MHEVLQFWSHYRQSHSLRASAQAVSEQEREMKTEATLQRMLDYALVDLTSQAKRHLTYILALARRAASSCDSS